MTQLRLDIKLNKITRKPIITVFETVIGLLLSLYITKDVTMIVISNAFRYNIVISQWR